MTEKKTVFFSNMAGVPTDYSNKSNWLHLPDAAPYDVDIFYLYPSTYAPKEADAPLFCSIDNALMRRFASRPYEQQARAFETIGNIYAPFYRQYDANQLAGAGEAEIREVSGKEQRTDIYAAFDYYFDHCNNGRPFLLAGHSQGAALLALVLEEYMAAYPARYANMIAAYQIGYPVTRHWLDHNPHLKFAQGADDTGVIVSWNTEGPGNKGKKSLAVWDDTVCINPLNWKLDETYAPVSANKGSLLLKKGGIPEAVPGIADARIDLERGVVVCESVDPAEFAMSNAEVFGPESYHGCDYGFYFENIRENAALRAAKFMKMQRT